VSWFQFLDSTMHSLNAILGSFGLVAVSEMGDKTQLLAFSLATRFKRPIPILLGIFVATVANHALAAWLGSAAATFVSPTTMSWILAFTFIACGFWALIPDKLEDQQGQTSS
jgi:putative Ca2+/H+ antiporter (TMEM165/GDT1 family)